MQRFVLQTLEQRYPKGQWRITELAALYIGADKTSIETGTYQPAPRAVYSAMGRAVRSLHRVGRLEDELDERGFALRYRAVSVVRPGPPKQHLQATNDHLRTAKEPT